VTFEAFMAVFHQNTTYSLEKLELKVPLLILPTCLIWMKFSTVDLY